MSPTWLFATGNNIFGQLSGQKADSLLERPQLVARADESIHVLWAGWFDTLLRIDGRYELRGFTAGSAGVVCLCCPDSVQIVSGFGSTELVGVVGSDGEVYSVSPDDEQDDSSSIKNRQLRPEYDLSDAFDSTICHICMTGNGLLSVLHDFGRVITVFESLSAFHANSANQPTHIAKKEFHPHRIRRSFIDIQAAESHFVALDSFGYVWSWGAPNLHGELLQPNTSAESKSTLLTPRIVSALEGISMMDISTNGWLTACISRDTKDIYLWGWMGTDGRRLIGLPMNINSGLAGIMDQFDEDEHIIPKSIGVGCGFMALAVENKETQSSEIYIAGESDVDRYRRSKPVHIEQSDAEDETADEFIRLFGEYDHLSSSTGSANTGCTSPIVYCAPAATFVLISQTPT
ncbi:uncharacterized protein V1516DRAFT_692376 [Lipomyces oligophaga]|uniref:uncharacterized protein n=1 Tax=Lipomyces oligophaga TaxID=45792 RepID=UPI0034CF9B57